MVRVAQGLVAAGALLIVVAGFSVSLLTGALYLTGFTLIGVGALVDFE